MASGLHIGSSYLRFYHEIASLGHFYLARVRGHDRDSPSASRRPGTCRGFRQFTKAMRRRRQTRARRSQRSGVARRLAECTRSGEVSHEGWSVSRRSGHNGSTFNGRAGNRLALDDEGPWCPHGSLQLLVSERPDRQPFPTESAMHLGRSHRETRPGANQDELRRR